MGNPPYTTLMDWRCKRHYVKKYFRLFYLEQNLKPARADDPLAEFLFFPHQRLQVSEKFSFQELSTTECARLCLQVTEQLIFNCSSFEYEVTANDCFLMGSFCLHGQLIYDGLRDYYELKVSVKWPVAYYNQILKLLGITYIRNIKLSSRADWESH